MATFHGSFPVHQAAGECFMVEMYEQFSYLFTQGYGDLDLTPTGWFRTRSAMSRSDAVAHARDMALANVKRTRVVPCDKCEDHAVADLMFVGLL